MYFETFYYTKFIFDLFNYKLKLESSIKDESNFIGKNDTKEIRKSGEMKN